jgi:hypothetical protein
MRAASLSLILLSAFRFFPLLPQHWTQTPNETIWREKYTNCDKAYAVSLPKGVIAHNGLPPSPNHGFLVSAEMPQTVSEVTLQAERLVGVTDSYYDPSDGAEFSSPQTYLKKELERAGAIEVFARSDAKFRGLPASYAHYRKKNGDVAVEEEEMIVFRSNPRKLSSLLYVIWLSTPSSHYEKDHKLFEQVRDGFHLLPDPSGKCSND